MEVHHSGGPPRSVSEIYQRTKNLSELYGKKILDRCVPISEYVYGPLRGEALVSKEILFEMIGNLSHEGWILIYCRPSNKTLIEYAETQLEESAKDKDHKPANHTNMVKQSMQTIIDRYDYVIDVCRAKGMLVFIYDRDLQLQGDLFPWTD